MKGICEGISSSLNSSIDGLNNEYKSQLAFINTRWSLSYAFRGVLRSLST